VTVTATVVVGPLATDVVLDDADSPPLPPHAATAAATTSAATAVHTCPVDPFVHRLIGR
jgi:hypothetical protein